MNARPFLLQALCLCQADASRCHRLSDAAHERGRPPDHAPLTEGGVGGVIAGMQGNLAASLLQC